MRRTSVFICASLLFSSLAIAQTSTPTLQQVTDAGNITTNSISVGNAQGIGIGVDASTGYTVNSHFLKPSADEYRTVRFDCSTIVADGGWEFYNSNQHTSLLYVKQSGNVGVGTNNPSSRLEVSGSVAIYDGNFYKIRSSSGASWASTNVLGHGWSGQQDYTTLLVPGSTANTAEIRLLANGNVGIGTANPATKLAVNGTISSTKVKVTQTGWSDFVFLPGYRLPRLSDLEKFVNENKHLPDIPSADDVKKNGIDVGDMQAKLLQKIEELTLYLIDLNKKVEAQQQLITSQQQLIKEQAETLNRIKEQHGR
jgi:hypothetical protein